MLCVAFSRWRKAEEALKKIERSDKATSGLLTRTKNGNIIQNPLVGIANRAKADYLKAAAEFGMTPSARSRVQSVNTKINNPYVRF